MTDAVLFFVIRDFNPHSHAGSDKIVPIINPHQNGISIHTPTQGVTDFYGKNVIVYGFQSTLPRRE